MLACPPTRLGLTPTDVANFDRKFAARQTGQQRRTQHAGFRIGRGAERLTRPTIVPAEANLGRQRADSCSSTATFCTVAEDNPSKDDGRDTHNDRPSEQIVHHVVESPAQQHGLDGATHDFPSGTTNSTQSAIPYKDKPLPELSSKRDSSISEESTAVRGLQQEPCIDAQENEVRAQGGGRVREDLLEIRLPSTVTQAPPNPHLDPGAPVFVPRTRYAADATPPGSTDLNTNRIIESNVRLRIRSSFERNTQHSSPHHGEPGDAAINAVALPNTSRVTRDRHPGQTNDQSGTRPRRTDFDQYTTVWHADQSEPLLNERRLSVVQRQPALPYRQSSRQHLVEFHQSRRSHDDSRRPRGQNAHLGVPRHDRNRPTSPAGSSSSVSTPNLLRGPPMRYIHNRSSSLAQKRNVSHNIENSRRPIPTSTSRNSSNSSLSNALDQLWLGRDSSPLDELAQQLSRLRPRSVGRSFERLPSAYNRPSLLNGDPFRLDASPERSPLVCEEDETLLGDSSNIEVPNTGPRVKDIRSEATAEDPVAVALALPPAAPPLSSPQNKSPQLPLTPPLRHPLPSSSPTSKSTSSPRPTSSTTSSTPRVRSPLGLATTTATPRLTVYDDHLPASHQPQTPADIASQARRRYRGRSDTSHNIASAERHPHRHTYPAQQPQGPLSPRRRNAAELSLHRRPSTTTTHRNLENDIEGSLDGLETDRRTWVRRREDGNLDVTPPREGRFERFLS